MKKKSFIACGLAALLLLAGCSSATSTSDKNSKSSKSNYPLTIHNYTKAEGGSEWKKKDQVIKKQPKRVMATTRTVAELLLHLGLKEQIVGVGGNFGAPDQTVAKDYDALKKLSSSYVGKEAAIGTNPDIIVSRGGLFDNADWGVGTVDSLNNMGINTYVLKSSIKGGTYDSIYEDIDNLGKLFNVQDRAKAFSDQLKAKQKKITSDLTKIKKPQTFAYLHMSDPKEVYVYSAYGETFFNNAFKMVKLDNVFQNQNGNVSVETLVKTNPDVLIVLDWEGDGKTMKKALYSNPKLSSMKAIKNKKIYTMDYNYMFSYSYNTLDGLENLTKEMYPDLYK
ncbi:ABC transporter substrate-binding protein [Sporolactobacillus terrae]|uniref:ABC transporter n=1 Tax=Sporolactobacillus terrae TaxID=269673 RepID=A0ABX5Q940_9BACL|nr:ABC transporter substrate-binding protein [Sporolactobacillus terrae]QAA23178.1 ABC transporter [Sporolactobacillus terrae]QAA26148.1 ABC transporter [Sporolactobacillus terrae]UAK15243.1 ABC transporter substrate-binding protein [Sporolactobacillus terrae]